MSRSDANIEIVPMTIDHYDAVRSLWQATDGVGLDASDEREGVARYLRRNPGLSLVAIGLGERVVGALLCGHDGRRGYLSHVAVAADARGAGVGRRLVETALGNLAAAGVLKCNVRIFAENGSAADFWARMGFEAREDLAVMQRLVRG